MERQRATRSQRAMGPPYLQVAFREIVKEPQGRVSDSGLAEDLFHEVPMNIR